MASWYEIKSVDLWKHLSSLREQDRLCAEDVKQLKEACDKDHGKKHAVECQDCYRKIIERMRRRYRNSPHQEWFSGYPELLDELDAVFAEAALHHADLKVVEAKIQQAKERWYRQGLELSHISKTVEDLRGGSTWLDRTDSESTQQLSQQISSGLGYAMGDKPTTTPTAFLAKFQSATSEDEVSELYTTLLFVDPVTGNIPPESQKYADMLRNGTPVERVMDTIGADAKAAQVQAEKKKSVQGRLGELKRAQTAQMQNKIRKAKGRQNQAALLSQAQGQGQKQTGEEVVDLSKGCAGCEKVVDEGGYFTCRTCRVLWMGGMREWLEVYCSESCCRKV
jgi:hypothetical protein